MILERLTVCDFRAYRGTHSVDLVPRVRYGVERPIILFGGLNGAGKTTLMLAIKLALYGRHALGMATPRTAYHRFIRESVHASSAVPAPRHKAAVEIDFVHGKLGERTRYTVRRAWSTASRKVREELSLSQDGEPLGLSPDACQGFLNELAPFGVSELFFFDGERIAELADDQTGRTLGDAIQRLLGLQHVERLRNDLRVYAVRQDANGADRQDAEEIDRLHSEYHDLLGELDLAGESLASARRHLAALREKHDRLDLHLSEQGGDWGLSREAWRAEATDLGDALQSAERELREQLAGIYPLCLASDALIPALDAASTSLRARAHAEANDLLTSFAATLKKELKALDAKRVDRLLDAAVKPAPRAEKPIDVSHRALGRMEHAARHSIPESKAKVERLVEAIGDAQRKLAATTLRMEQAPDEEALAAEVGTLANLAEQINDAAVDVRVRTRELASQYRQAIARARILRDKHTALSKQQEMLRPLEYAERTRRLLADFRRAKARRKVEELEHEFGASFQELARKDDQVASARVDPRNFTVKLLNRQGRELRKAQLSAGEKQIYAIAMLDALTRTSGRRLPVVIDAPLGRLDSQHRSNLVSSYFPRASHQVILLSTDVEVDRSFYRELSPHVSHAFEIRYDAAKQASALYQGYFWRPHARMAG